MQTIIFNNKRLIPSKIVCVGMNYVEHIRELDNKKPSKMVIFNKSNSAISDRLFYFNDKVRYESEISFLINENEIDGVGFGLDLTKADVQNHLKESGHPWERSKSFNRSAVFSKFVKLTGDITKLKLELFINDKLVQFANYDLMIYKPQKVINEIKSFMNFENGDIVMTGTPKGVGNYKRGDKFIGRIYCGDELLIDKEWIVE